MVSRGLFQPHNSVILKYMYFLSSLKIEWENFLDTIYDVSFSLKIVEIINLGF